MYKMTWGESLLVFCFYRLIFPQSKIIYKEKKIMRNVLNISASTAVPYYIQSKFCSLHSLI